MVVLHDRFLTGFEDRFGEGFEIEDRFGDGFEFEDRFGERQGGGQTLWMEDLAHAGDGSLFPCEVVESDGKYPWEVLSKDRRKQNLME